jgi:tRNA threonylcarbamoyladenosine modification (KEOPS) complex  Pcc1 subunit
LVFDYGNSEDASKVLKAVELDNEDFVDARIVGGKLVSKIKADNLSSLRHTIDDYLACIAVAERIISSQ